MTAQHGQIVSIFRERLYLIGLFIVIILLIMAQAASMGVSKLEREIIRYERGLNQTLHVRLTLQEMRQWTPDSIKERGIHKELNLLRDLKTQVDGLPELQLDQSLNMIQEAGGLFQQVISDLEIRIASDEQYLAPSGSLHSLDRVLIEIGVLYRDRSDLILVNKERYQLLSRLYWGGFTLITLLMLFWNIVQRRKLEEDLGNQHWLLEEAVDKRTADLQRLVRGLEERIKKMLEDD